MARAGWFGYRQRSDWRLWFAAAAALTLLSIVTGGGRRGDREQGVPTLAIPAPDLDEHSVPIGR